MAHVIPAILEADFEAVAARVQQLQDVAPLAQLDVMDGEFVPNLTFRDPLKVAQLPLQFEIHLMIEKPVLSIQQWALPNVVRLIVHYEAIDNLEHIVNAIKQTGKQVGLAINPDTSTHVLKDIIDQLDTVMVMGVEPGFAGQKFHRDVLEKIKEIKLMRPDIVVEVDGGVNDLTAPDIIKAGADILNVNSWFWGSPDLKQALATMEQLG